MKPGLAQSNYNFSARVDAENQKYFVTIWTLLLPIYLYTLILTKIYIGLSNGHTTFLNTSLLLKKKKSYSTHKFAY